MTPWDEAIARWSFDKGLPAGAGTDTLPGVPYQILPLRSADKNQGLVIVEPSNLRQLMIPEQQRLLETFTLLVASALERLPLEHAAAAVAGGVFCAVGGARGGGGAAYRQ
mgnify:CR=1 FL=1